MKNIGIITHNFPKNAKDRQNAGIFVNDLAQELSKTKKITVFSPNDSGSSGKIGRVSVKSFNWIYGKKLGDLNFLNPIDIFRFFSFFVGGIWKTPGFIVKNIIDVNIVMWAFPGGIFAYLAKKLFKTPYIVWCLGSDIYIYGKKPILRAMVRNILKNADVVLADGIDLTRETEKLSGVKCFFLPSASKTDSVGRMGIHSSKFMELTFVGRLENVKGPDILIRSLISIKDKLEGFKINIIGSGSLFDRLKNEVTDANITDKVTFYGNVSDFRKIGEVIRRSDWLIIPSRSDSIPLVFSEAMKCKTPIIASALPDLSYLVKRYKVGYLFNPGDFRQLAQIIVKLPRLKKERLCFSKNTLIASRDFSVEKSAKEILSYIKRI